MRRELSKHNLVYRRLQEMTEPPKGFLVSLLGLFQKGSKEAKDDLWIKLPRYEVLRAQMFLDDLDEISEEVLNLNVGILIALLYQDFMRQISRGGTELKAIASYLRKKQQQYLAPNQVAEELKYITPNHLTRVEVAVPKKVKHVQIGIEIPRKRVTRGEVMLLDLAKLEPQFSMTLEELIAVLVLDFVNEIQKGNDAHLIENIIANLSDDR